jgi:serine/threonine protein kinase
MKCPNCGIENDGDAKYCNDCGTALSDASSNVITQIMDKIDPDKYLVKERFKIIKKLGAGGMGEVFMAEDIKLKRKVAIKSILSGGHADTSSKIRFLREAQTASQLDHSNICTIYEIYEDEEKEYIVMQFIDGITLDQIIGVKKLGIEKIIDISLQISSGMEEAHSNDIMHRDIKPGNIMIDKKGVVKILDFGLAKFSNEGANKSAPVTQANLTEKGFVMGTVAYISPEQAKGKNLDHRTDIFSFGVLLYEMLEGRNPFKCEEQIETLYNVLNKDVEFERDIPPPLKDIVRKALAKEKENRYGDFAALRQDLETLRTAYLGSGSLKQIETPLDGKTEIIDVEEKAVILEEMQKSSDKEDLGAMVSRIKKFKASTERVAPTQLHKRKLLWGIPLLVILVIAGYFLLKPDPVKPPPPEGFYILLQPFEAQSKSIDSSMPEKINYLLNESLGQFKEFKIINRETALSLMGEDAKTFDAKFLEEKYKIDIKFRLTGKISKKKKFYVSEATLAAYNPDPKAKTTKDRFTATGPGRDSLLTGQVDTLVRGIYEHLYPDRAKTFHLIRTKGIFGGRWVDFSNFYQGIKLYKKLEHTKSEPWLKKAGKLPIANYYLADQYHFKGNRADAKTLIINIMPHDRLLTPPLSLKVKALKARLEFNFKEEIKHLDELITRLPHSKEALYQMGEAYFHYAHPKEAIPYYEDAIKLDRKDPRPINHLGYCYAYLGKIADAKKAFQENSELDPTPNSYDSWGDGYFYAGDLNNALNMKSFALQPDANNKRIPWPYQTLSDIYILKALYEKAEKALSEYGEMEKTVKDQGYLFRKHAFIQYEYHNYEKALELIDKSLDTYSSEDINDNTPEDQYLKGLILLELKKVEDSKNSLVELENFKKNYQLDAENFKAAYKYYIHLKALIAEKENRTDDAENGFKALLAMKDRLSYWTTYFHYQYYHTQYAAFLTRQERYDDALKEIAECLTFSSADFPYIPALWVKAQVLEKQNKTAEAKDVYLQLNDLYGEFNEKNYLRNLLKTKLSK